MMGRIWLALAAFALLALPARGSDEYARAMAQLDVVDETVVTIDMKDAELRDVIDELNHLSPLQVRADWEPLRRLTINDDSELTVRFERESLSTVLRAITTMLGDEFERPTFEYSAGQMVLTTYEGAGAMKIAGVYVVNDLLQDKMVMQKLIDQAPPIETIDADETAEAADEPDAPESQSETLPPPLLPAEQLLRLLCEHVDPEAWQNFGGSRARIDVYNGDVVVTATPSVHRKLRETIAQLRAVHPTNLVLEAAIVELPSAGYDQLVRRHRAGSADLARAILADERAIEVWRTGTAVVIGGDQTIIAEHGDHRIELTIAPRRNEQTGLLELALQLKRTSDGSSSRLESTVAIVDRTQAAVVQIPPAPTESGAAQSDIVQLLVLSP